MRMNALRSCWLLLLFQLTLCTSQETLWTLVQNNPNTTKFASFIREAQLDSQFQATGCTGSGADCISLFAPNNVAIEAAMTMINWGQMNQVQKMLFVSSYVLRHSTPLNTNRWNQMGQPMNLINIGFDTGRLYELSYSTQRYMFQSLPVPQYGPNNLYFVSNALVSEPDLAASNGVMHVVDNVLYTPDSTTNFITYMSTQSDLTTSAQLWTLLGNDPRYMPFLNQWWNDKAIYSTFFVVTNDGWAQIPNEQLTQLQTNITLLATVLANHYLPNQLLYSEWTAVQNTVNFFTGFPTDPTAVDTTQMTGGSMNRMLDGSIIVKLGGSAATIQGPSKEIKQAVLHKIPSPLGFVYETREQVLARLNAQLLTACQTDTSCNNLLTNEAQLTIFSPNANAMQRLNGINAEQKTKVLKYLFIPGKILRNQMTDLKTLTVNGMVDAIRFRVEGQVIYVDGRLPNQGYVPTTVSAYDELATNGVIHVIDGLPCIPNEKVEDFIARTGKFSKFAAYQFIQNMTLGGPYTYCAPTNAALMAMETSSTVGQPILQNKERREYVFRRHTFPTRLLLDELKVKAYDVATANYAFTREEVRLAVTSAANGRAGTLTFEGQSTEINTRTGGLEFTNGFLYALDKIIYTASDLTRQLCNQKGCP